MNLAKLKRLMNSEVEKTQKELSKYSKPTIEINNSFSKLYLIPPKLQEEIKAALTYKNEEIEGEKIQAFKLLKIAKAKNNKKMLWVAKKRLEELQGKEYVCWLKNNSFPTGHLGIVFDICANPLAYDQIEVVDKRKHPEPCLTLRWNNIPPDPRYYQKDMIALAVEKERGVFESAVGTGKSLILTYILKELSVPSLIVLPSTALIEQMSRSLELAFGAKNIAQIDTKLIKSGKRLAPIRLVTIQTLASLNKNGLLKPLLEDIDLLAVDEIHHAGSKSYTDLLPELDHIYYRFGFTGTFLRNDSKTLDMWGFLSNKLYFYPPYKATQEGFLTPVDFYVTTIEGKRCQDYQREYKENYCGKPEILGAIGDILRNIPNNEQTLILVDRKDSAGAVIHEYLTNLGIANKYISGNDKKEVICNAIEAFNEKKIKVLIGSTVIGEGVDVHSTQHLIMARGGKSEIAVVQAIGRCVRLHPGKARSSVYDFKFEGTKFLEKHLDQRVDIYKNQFDGKITYL